MHLAIRFAVAGVILLPHLLRRGLALARVIAGYRTLLGDASAQLLLLINRGYRGRVAPLPRAAE